MRVNTSLPMWAHNFLLGSNFPDIESSQFTVLTQCSPAGYRLVLARTRDIRREPKFPSDLTSSAVAAGALPRHTRSPSIKNGDIYGGFEESGP